MKYLFFDIECSNCFNGIGKMVEFGYVLTDENFKILRKNEYVMSPGRGYENRFYLKGRKGQRDIELAYDYDYYYEQPEFYTFYDSIKKLIEGEDTLCFAWSSENDMLHLFHTCKRYRKRAFKYICYDVQKIAAKYLEINKQVSLKNACISIVGKTSTIQLQEHLSSDDAKMTMMILEALCVLERKNSTDFLAESEYAKDDSYDFVVNFKERKKDIKESRDRYQHYKKIAKEDESLIDDPSFKGKRFNFSDDLKRKVINLQTAIDKVHSIGGIVVDSLEETDFFVTFDEKNLKEIKEKFKGKREMPFMLLDELMAKQEPEIIHVT